MGLLLAISPVNATFILAVIVLIAAVGLSVLATLTPGENSKQLFAIIGVMFGLFGAGGLGSLFAKQAATEAANQAAPQAATEAVDQAAKEKEEPAAGQGNTDKGQGGSSEAQGGSEANPK